MSNTETLGWAGPAAGSLAALLAALHTDGTEASHTKRHAMPRRMAPRSCAWCRSFPTTTHHRPFVCAAAAEAAPVGSANPFARALPLLLTRVGFICYPLSSSFASVSPFPRPLPRPFVRASQEELGDVVYVELPEEGAEFEKGDSFATIESVKAASDVYMPVSGTVVTVNSSLADEPSKVNEDSYAEGWLVKLKLANPAEVEEMMDAAAYTASTES